MARYSLAYLALVGTAAAAQGSAYAQCGGDGWTGATSCVSGYHCQAQNDWYSQCIPGAGAATSAAKTVTPVKTSAAAKPHTVVATTLQTVKRPSCE